MSADNDPAPSGPAAADAQGPADELEDWLSGLRTDEFAGGRPAPGEVDEEPGGDRPAGPAVEQPTAGGRHRAPE
ncbi:hypothetical protein [Actinoplanes subtropicus]|uniref:hypothetical protein n=1 Tax=Actinoplanes subtropicus TaxID=543632 RepID=UPI0004C3B590|nr:hypothetical protein [Actinoplanes subtropicus]